MKENRRASCFLAGWRGGEGGGARAGRSESALKNAETPAGEAAAGQSSPESKSAGRRDAEGEQHWLRESGKAGIAGIRGWKDGRAEASGPDLTPPSPTQR